MSGPETLRSIAECMTYADLPVGIYLVDANGLLVDANDAARRVLALPASGDIQRSMESYYDNPDLRQQLVASVIDSNSSKRLIVPLVVNGRRILVRENCRAVRHPDTKDCLGLVCCIDEISDDVGYQALDEFPAGVYQLDRDDIIQRVNTAFAQIHGFADPGELIGKYVGDLYVNETDLIVLRQHLDADGKVMNFHVPLKRQNGRSFFGSVTARAVLLADGTYDGRQGTVIDITADEYRRQITEVMPLGFYVIDHRDDGEIIVDCNQQFARLQGLQREEAIGREVGSMYSSQEQYQNFKLAFSKAAANRSPLRNYELHMSDMNRRPRVFRVSACPLSGPGGEPSGRVGVIEDVTELKSLEQTLHELRADVGQVLHSYTTMLAMAQLALDPVTESQGEDPFVGRNVLEDPAVPAMFARPAQILSTSLARLEGALVQRGDYTDQQAKVLTTFERYRSILTTDPDDPLQRALQVPKYHLIALRVRRDCSLIDAAPAPRETLRTVRDHAGELIRLCNLLNLHRVRSSVLEMAYPLNSLREKFVSQTGHVSERERMSILRLIRGTTVQLQDYARSRNVEIRYTIDNPSIRIDVNRRDVIRAFGNILHNAIKYSWTRDEQYIRVFTDDTNGSACISVESWGVAIPRDEIESGALLRFGFRGRRSGDRRRIGSGIGLADADRVAKAHNGRIVIQSKLARPGASEDDYTAPFLTTVTLELPIADRKGEDATSTLD